MFGDFRALDKRIKAVSESVDSLVNVIIQDLVSDDDSGHMAKVYQIYCNLFYLTLHVFLG